MDMIAVPSSRGTPNSRPEHGAGLTGRVIDFDLLKTAPRPEDGWLTLADGPQGAGWRGADPEKEPELSLVSTVRFGNSFVLGEFAGKGSVSVGGTEHKVAKDVPLLVMASGKKDFIRLGKGLTIKSLHLKPLSTRPLFNGKDLTGWKHIQRKPKPPEESAWRIETDSLRSVIRAVGGPEALEYTEKEFGDFVLQIDVRTRAVHSNGGVFFRAIAGDFMNGYEAQLHNRCLDNDPAKPFRYCTGGIDDRLDARRQIARDFMTFKMTIIADGPRIATWVNGYQTVDFLDERPEHDNPREGKRVKAGVIQLQAHDPATDYEVRGISIADWDK
jgi:hypothetical protein